MSNDILERLRAAHPGSMQLVVGSKILAEAADEIERLRAERDEVFLENGKLANTIGADALRLRAALRAGAYYINRLEAANRGHVVRDLDEACNAWEHHQRLTQQTAPDIKNGA